jgi:hypothetical protein
MPASNWLSVFSTKGNVFSSDVFGYSSLMVTAGCSASSLAGSDRVVLHGIT